MAGFISEFKEWMTRMSRLENFINNEVVIDVYLSHKGGGKYHKNL
jgi:hypothetical protein